MEFGKIKGPLPKQLLLPSDPISNEVRLSHLRGSNNQMEVLIGMTAWTLPEWKGNFYPPKIKPNEYLKYYSRPFKTIEFNTTHYRIPSIEQTTKWYEQAAEGFKFSPKIPKVISHRKLGPNSLEYMQYFNEAISPFQEKMGCCFYQLPPTFGPSQKEALKAFLLNMSFNHPLSMEFRHEAWFNQIDELEEMMGWLADHGLYTCITDVAGRRDVLHMHLTGKMCCIRFVSTGDSTLDEQRIRDWATRICSWAQLGVQSIYFFLHHPDNIKAAELSVYLHDELKKKDSKIKCLRPSQYEEGESQMKLF